MRRIIGWGLLATGFLACPCHLLVIWLLFAPLFAGTALGSFLTHQALLLYVFATLYFIMALVIGDKLLSSLKHSQHSSLECQQEQSPNKCKHCH